MEPQVSPDLGRKVAAPIRFISGQLTDGANWRTVGRPADARAAGRDAAVI